MADELDLSIRPTEDNKAYMVLGYRIPKTVGARKVVQDWDQARILSPLAGYLLSEMGGRARPAALAAKIVEATGVTRLLARLTLRAMIATRFAFALHIPLRGTILFLPPGVEFPGNDDKVVEETEETVEVTI